MHVHPVTSAIPLIGTYALANEHAAAAQRAAEIRKRLRRSAQSLDAGDDPEATLLIGQWLDASPDRALADDEYHASAQEDSDPGRF